jgi:hypothetical protein
VDAASFATLDELPFASGAEGKMRVLQHPETRKERVKPQSSSENILSPNSAPGAHEVDLPQAVVRGLQVSIDWIPNVVVVSTGFVGCEKLDSSVEAPPARRRRIKMLVADVTGDTANFSDLVGYENSKDGLEKFGLEPNIVINERDVVPIGIVDAHVSLNCRTAALPDKPQLEWNR